LTQFPKMFYFKIGLSRHKPLLNCIITPSVKFTCIFSRVSCNFRTFSYDVKVTPTSLNTPKSECFLLDVRLSVFHYLLCAGLWSSLCIGNSFLNSFGPRMWTSHNLSKSTFNSGENRASKLIYDDDDGKVYREVFHFISFHFFISVKLTILRFLILHIWASQVFPIRWQKFNNTNYATLLHYFIYKKRNRILKVKEKEWILKTQ
jgi:hypothetical protein